jgi:CheY-like chemotaxis protein
MLLSSASSPPAKPLIYLVDDEPLLLDLAELVLEADGYEFLKFTDPEPALECLRTAGAPPNLLLTDYAMRSMNGLDFIGHCRQLYPQLKAILISGTVDEHILESTPLRVDAFLRKPFHTRELASIVRSLLRPEAPPAELV